MGLKIKIGADSTELRKELKEADRSVRSFEREGSSALQQLGSAIGVDVNKVKELGDVFQGAGAKMAKAMGKGNDAVIKMGNVMKAVGGIASVAVAGIAIAWNSAKSAADSYYQTVEGQRSKAGLEAFQSAYQGIMDEAARTLTGGKEITFFEKFKRGWSEFKSIFNSFKTIQSQTQSPGLAGLTTLMAHLTAQSGARQSEEIAEKIYDVELKRSHNLAEIAKLDVKINENRLKSKNTLLSLTEQQEAQDAATAAMNDKLHLQLDIEQELVSLKQLLLSKSPSSKEEIMEVDQMLANIELIKASYYSAMNELAENGRRLAKEWRIAPKVDLTEGIKEAVDAIENEDIIVPIPVEYELKDKLEEVPGIDGQPILVPLEFTGSLTDSLLKLQEVANGNPISLPVVPTTLEEEIEQEWEHIQQLCTENPIEIPLMANVKQAEIDMLPSIVAFGESISYAVGEMVGNLVNGEDAWGNFSNAALSAFGDMAISVGKLAISTGLATEAIQASLETLQGWGAIAAGAALVALGAAVKTSAANIASGGYSSAPMSSNYNSSYQSGSFNDFYERNLEIVVKGELVAEGSQLKAIINNEDSRTRRTT